ncbi:MAG: radical SAM protein [Ideonella sp.]|nr:radical SAM protein [Ideonella sp.]
MKPARLLELCAAFERSFDFRFGFSAITRANLVTPELLAAMRRAGLVHVNFGVESGDDRILAAIKKGIRTDQVVRALTWAKELGLATACNFMLGFPQEDEAAVERTLRFMESIAPLTDTFSTLGVVVPFPGTPIYDDYHLEYGFTDWWLQEDFSRYAPPPPIEEREAFHRYYTDDANLGLDFFRYGPGMRELIREGLRFKAEHNLKAMGLLPDPVFRPVPAMAQ